VEGTMMLAYLTLRISYMTTILTAPENAGSLGYSEGYTDAPLSIFDGKKRLMVWEIQ
jgi:hypothetical protein